MFKFVSLQTEFKEMESKRRFVSPIKRYYELNALYVFLCIKDA